MSASGFVSAWTPGFTDLHNKNRPQMCRSAHRMSLISHEKLEVIHSSEESELAKYKLELEIPSSYSKNKRRQSIQVLKQNANFPGFRKGTIPPFVMKDVPVFVLRDSVDDMLENALKELDMTPADKEMSGAEVDLDDLRKRFTVGEDFRFTLEMPLRKILVDLDPADLPEDLVDVDVDSSDASILNRVDESVLESIEPGISDNESS